MAITAYPLREHLGSSPFFVEFLMLIFLVFYGVFFVLFVFVLCLVYPMLQLSLNYIFLRRVWRYQRGNQNTYIEEEQTTQWPKEKVQKDKQRSTKHTYKTKDRVTRTPRKTGRDELRLSGRVGSSCSTSDTRRVNLVVNSVISREWGKDREVLTTSEAYPWSFTTQIFHNGQQFMVATVKLSKWWLQLIQ